MSAYRRLREWKAKESDAVNRQETLEAELAEWSEAFEQLFKRSFIANDVIEKFKEMKRIFRDIKKEQREMQEYIKKTEEIQHEINYYVQKVSELKKAKHQFFESLNAANKEEVYDLYAAQKEKEENETRLAVLLEKLPVKDDGDLKSRLQDLNISINEIEERQQTFKKRSESDLERDDGNRNADQASRRWWDLY
ncbi:MAG: hypothetical protein U5K84_01990 [Alkalibacterium sp.]|nr:hypothetical protein [Alkalibacterium sp.]